MEIGQYYAPLLWVTGYLNMAIHPHHILETMFGSLQYGKLLVEFSIMEVYHVCFHKLYLYKDPHAFSRYRFTSQSPSQLHQRSFYNLLPRSSIILFVRRRLSPKLGYFKPTQGNAGA